MTQNCNTVYEKKKKVLPNNCFFVEIQSVITYFHVISIFICRESFICCFFFFSVDKLLLDFF